MTTRKESNALDGQIRNTASKYNKKLTKPYRLLKTATSEAKRLRRAIFSN